MLPAVRPSIRRPRISTHNAPPRPHTAKPSAEPQSESSTTGRRPNRSLTAPSTGAAINEHRAYTARINETQNATSRAATYRATENGSTGMISVKPAKLRKTEMTRMPLRLKKRPKNAWIRETCMMAPGACSTGAVHRHENDTDEQLDATLRRLIVEGTHAKSQ